MNVLAAALATVYLFSAITMPAGHGAVAAGEAGIAVLQLAWLGLVALRSRSGWVYGAGIALQLGLTALWIVARSASSICCVRLTRSPSPACAGAARPSPLRWLRACVSAPASSP
jgi:hypothetical protein